MRGKTTNGLTLPTLCTCWNLATLAFFRLFSPWHIQSPTQSTEGTQLRIQWAALWALMSGMLIKKTVCKNLSGTENEKILNSFDFVSSPKIREKTLCFEAILGHFRFSRKPFSVDIFFWNFPKLLYRQCFQFYERNFRCCSSYISGRAAFVRVIEKFGFRVFPTFFKHVFFLKCFERDFGTQYRVCK